MDDTENSNDNDYTPSLTYSNVDHSNSIVPVFTRTQLAERLIKLDGNPFSLEDNYKIYQAIYNGNYKKMLLVNGRQTGKSITFSNFMVLNSVARPHHKSLYVSPSEAQTTRFSHSKLKKAIKSSKALKAMFTGGTDNVTLKIANNESEINLSYASDDPDRIRGITSDDNYYDEVQDMDLSEVMIIAGACLDASQNPREYISGTPKTVENPLEDQWSMSSQSEVLVYCEACNKYNKPGIKNIGKHGFICQKCGRTLDVRNFVWYDFNKNGKFKGFHIPQIVVPNHTMNPDKWAKLLEKFELWPRNKFNNEIMAISDSLGTRLITKEDLLCLCHDYEISRYPEPALVKDIEFNTAGIDWSGGGKDGVSRTVVHIWGVRPDFKLKTLYSEIYVGQDPVQSLDSIVKVLSDFGVRFVIGDRGEGSLANGILAEKLGRHRVGQAQYGSNKEPITLDPETGVYRLDKTIIIDNYFKFLKDKGIIYPNAVQAKIMIEDSLNEFSEITRMGKKIWTHSSSKPDDSLHAQIFGWLAAKILKRDLTFY